jgi:hypothetical protein
MLTSFEIEAFLDEEGIRANEKMLAPGNYALPALDWVVGEYATALRRFYAAFGTEFYKLGSNDCKSFARGANFLAQTLHARSGQFGSGLLCFGEIWYDRDAGGGHAVNLFITRPTRLAPLKVFFFEPQTATDSSLVQLSGSERRNVLAYRIG